MENRFGFRDLLISFLLVLLIAVVALGMKQLDRQWVLIQSMLDQGREQTELLARIQRTLAEGVPTAAATTQSTSATQYPKGDAFEYLKEAENKPDFARGDWLISNFGTKLPKITPLISTDEYGAILQARVIESLNFRDPTTLEYRPQLATDWQISDDGLTLTFELRHGVTFSDGEPFTADDVVYSYNLVMNPKIDAPRIRAYFDKIKSVEKDGDFKVIFKMTEPYFEALDLCGGINVLPKHFYSKYSDEEINTNPGLLMGTGPYKMGDPAGWRPGQKVEVFRNETYWGEPPTFNRIVYLEVEEEAAEETMFGNGELDIFGPEPEQYIRLVHDPRTTAHANHLEYNNLLAGYSFIAWNEKRGGKPTLWADPRLRKAMTLLTDRQRIAKEIYLGYATVVSGPFDPNSPQADPSIKPLPYDPDAAKKLLADAGYADRNGSGVLQGPDGQPLRIKLSYPSGSATVERVVLLLKDTYAKAGVTLEPDPEDWPIMMKKLDTRDFDAITLSWGGAIESDLYQEFDSSQQADQGDNFMGYSNPELDKVVREARRTVDDAKRMELWHKAHAILNDDQPYTFLLSHQALVLMDKRIQNVKRSKVSLNFVSLYSMPNPWFVPKPMQKYSE
jgi:peptide/nickel transport system substrate-binding protein